MPLIFIMALARENSLRKVWRMHWGAVKPSNTALIARGRLILAVTPMPQTFSFFQERRLDAFLLVGVYVRIIQSNNTLSPGEPANTGTKT